MLVGVIMLGEVFLGVKKMMLQLQLQAHRLTQQLVLKVLLVMRMFLLLVQ
jgi:hypothetical protein